MGEDSKGKCGELVKEMREEWGKERKEQGRGVSSREGVWERGGEGVYG